MTDREPAEQDDVAEYLDQLAKNPTNNVTIINLDAHG